MTKLAPVALLGLLCPLAACAADSSSENAADDSAALGTSQKSVAIGLGSMQHEELEKTLRIGKSEADAERRVVLRLDPKRLPSLAAGDRLIVPAQLQLTTSCDIGQTGPGCGYDPHVKALILVSGNAGDTSAAGSSQVIAEQEQTCTSMEHHCMFVFAPPDATATLNDMPCIAQKSCVINLVMWAWHSASHAGSADVILVGQNNGDYLQNHDVTGDQAHLMMVDERGPITNADRDTKESSGGGDRDVPTTAKEVLIYSHKLADKLVAGEQYVVEASMLEVATGRPRVSMTMFVTKDPQSTNEHGFDSVTPAHIDEGSGHNCSTGMSPCRAKNVAVFRVDQDTNAPVYVNVTALSAVPGGAPAHVTIRRNDGFVRSTRYAASLAR